MNLRLETQTFALARRITDATAAFPVPLLWRIRVGLREQMPTKKHVAPLELAIVANPVSIYMALLAELTSFCGPQHDCFVPSCTGA
jgi:hypothetical protein